MVSRVIIVSVRGQQNFIGTVSVSDELWLVSAANLVRPAAAAEPAADDDEMMTQIHWRLALPALPAERRARGEGGRGSEIDSGAQRCAARRDGRPGGAYD